MGRKLLRAERGGETLVDRTLMISTPWVPIPERALPEKQG